MGKYKVGDKVKLVRTKDESFLYQIYLGKEYTIKDILNGDFGKYAVLKETNVIFPYLKNLELVNKKYTYEDLKKSPIGTKITFENGDIFIKLEEDNYESRTSYRNNENLKGLKDNINLRKIIKIEEPEYSTVYESKAEILDKVEKRYLRNIIRPFRNKVKYIKLIHKVNKIEGYININLEDEQINLPYFNINSMYKGMEPNKEYNLKELGL